MKKIYKSDAVISINIILSNGANKHIAFEPRTSGESVFLTDDEEIQNALERHWRYGDLFTGNAFEQPKEEQPEAVESKDPETIIVEVSDLGEAKEYLADKYGLLRSSLRSKEKIVAAAAAHNVEFKGI